MQNNTSLWLGVGVCVAALLVGAVFVVRPHTVSAPTATSTGQTGSTTNLGSVSVLASGGVTIAPVPSAPSAQAPNLDHAVVYSSALPPDAVVALKAQIAEAVAELKADPSQGGNWLQLGIDYKIAGDYSAAANVWIYLTQVASTSYVAFADLGDLYQNFLVNYPKAEANYLEAIKLNPTDPDYYANLYNIYRYHDNNMAEANAIVSQGLKANPGNQELLQLQAQASAQ